jgi:hypothetical protein
LTLRLDLTLPPDLIIGLAHRMRDSENDLRYDTDRPASNKPAAAGLLVLQPTVHFESVSGVAMIVPSLSVAVALSAAGCSVAAVSLMAAGVSETAGVVSSSATATVANDPADISKTSNDASVRFIAGSFA